MTLATFNPTPAPSIGASKKREFKVLEAEFGDGYAQAAGAGMNYIRKVLELEWSVLTASQAAAISSFFEAQAGVTPFFYTPPGESSALKFTCREWSETYNQAGFVSIRATLRQSFNIVV